MEVIQKEQLLVVGHGPGLVSQMLKGYSHNFALQFFYGYQSTVDMSDMLASLFMFCL